MSELLLGVGQAALQSFELAEPLFKGLLSNGLEAVIDAASTLDDTVQQILSESGLDGILPIDC